MSHVIATTSTAVNIMSFDAAADEIDDKAFTVVIKVNYDDEDDKTMTDASGETAWYGCPIFS